MPHAPLHTFRLRRGRVGAGRASALERLWSRWGIDVDGRPLDLAALFGREAPVVLEVGCGMGEAAAACAVAEPDRDLLAVDVHTPGHGNLLALVEAAGLTNLRVADGDAVLLLSGMLGPGSLDEVRVWFPDPWPKARHAKRRLLTAEFVALAASRLRPGGLLHVATDDDAYFRVAQGHLSGTPDLAVLPVAPRRPVTRFEVRARAAGREPRDLAAVRTTPSLRSAAQA